VSDGDKEVGKGDLDDGGRDGDSGWRRKGSKMPGNGGEETLDVVLGGDGCGRDGGDRDIRQIKSAREEGGRVKSHENGRRGNRRTGKRDGSRRKRLGEIQLLFGSVRTRWKDDSKACQG